MSFSAFIADSIKRFNSLRFRSTPMSFPIKSLFELQEPPTKLNESSFKIL